jgi:hypothetical protein
LLVEEGERAALNFQRKDFEIVQQDQVRDPSPTNRALLDTLSNVLSDGRVGVKKMGCLFYLRKQTSVSYAADCDVVVCCGGTKLATKANPGKYDGACSGTGTTAYLIGHAPQ